MASKVAMNDLNQLKEIAKEHWDKFTNEDLDRIEGRRDEWVELVQTRYGYAKQRAENEVDQLFSTVDNQKQKFMDDLIIRTDEARQRLDQTLKQYDQKIQETAQNLPGSMDQALMKYPWLSLVTLLGVGLIMGFMLKPRR